jgi:signal transduction histidine kinase
MREPSPAALELDRQFRVEYGARREVAVRFLGTSVAAVLIHGYAGWAAAWVWLAGFLLAHAAYFTFLRRRRPCAKPRDETVAGLLFLAVLISFLWLPARMIGQSDPLLMLCGAAMLGCILVFLVSRSDIAPFLVWGEVLVVSLVILAVFAEVLPRFDHPIGRLGLVASGLALLFYFAQAAQVARRMRIEGAEAGQRALQAEKMAAIGRLAGGVAHDFNNNLTAILGHLELLALIEDPKDRAASLDEATLAAQQAARTVRQLLTFARKERMVLEPLDALEVIDGLVTLTRRLIPVTIRLRPVSSEGRFLADRGQLYSALINLVVNAVDAMPRGGEIRLAAESLRLDHPEPQADGALLAPGDYVALSVEDQGKGIPPEIRAQVLEPFFTTKPAGKGTGLGLPMALGVARACGGGLVIASSERGTRVTMLIPQEGSRG